MRHIASTPRGRLARTQQDLVSIATSESPIREEIIEHPISEVGFCEYTEDGLQRMSDHVFVGMVQTLFKSRPSARKWDIIPSIPHTEYRVLIESPEGFKMTFAEKANLLGDEFLRRPQMVGFRLELHNIDRRTNTSTPRSSISLTVYEASEPFDSYEIPTKVVVSYRVIF